ncbi:VQ motif-containing protein 22-like [Malus sylvestris]|uniref:VQ motif-containing protein 22-like n=1 Tax=Malus sylvestris TaxID=3752 RepID=UPI0021ACA96E|nr:VQ motif-containing protein 22-like [Malus sylvestris]
MSSTGTMSSNPNDHWLQFYNQNLNSSTPSSLFCHDQVSDATVVTTTTTTSSLPGHAGSGHPSSSTNNSLSPDQGRVSKPARKRSRASRRTPTTLLNTDTTNFRAMVQQFTGGPSTVSFPTGASNFSFGLGPTRPQSFVVPPGAAGCHPLQPQQQQLLQQQQQQQQQYQQRHNQQYLFSLRNNDNVNGDHGFLERMSSRVGPTSMVMGLSSDHDQHEFLREGIASQLPSSARPPSSNSSANENRSYMF